MGRVTLSAETRRALEASPAASRAFASHAALEEGSASPLEAARRLKEQRAAEVEDDAARRLAERRARIASARGRRRYRRSSRRSGTCQAAAAGSGCAARDAQLARRVAPQRVQWVERRWRRRRWRWCDGGGDADDDEQ